VDVVEYERFFRAAYPLLTRYAQRRFTPEVAEELASATLLKIWTKDVDPPRDDAEWRRLHAFAYRILDGYMKNLARAEAARGDMIRRVGRDHLAAVVPDISEEVLDAGRPEWIEPLPLTDLELLELVIDGYKVAEIALILGRTPAAVSMRLQRAKRKALELWRKEVGRGERRTSG